MQGPVEKSYVGLLCVTFPLGTGSGLILFGDQQFEFEGKSVNLYGVNLRGRDPNKFTGEHLRVTGPLIPPGRDPETPWPVIAASKVEIVPYVGRHEMNFVSDELSLKVAITPPDFSWTHLSDEPAIRAVLTNRGANARDFKFKDSGRIRLTVTEIKALPILTSTQTWIFVEKANSGPGSINLQSGDSFQVQVDLSAAGAPHPGTYVLAVEVCEHEQYRTQTQFLIRP